MKIYVLNILHISTEEIAEHENYVFKDIKEADTKYWSELTEWESNIQEESEFDEDEIGEWLSAHIVREDYSVTTDSGFNLAAIFNDSNENIYAIKHYVDDDGNEDVFELKTFDI